MHKSRTGIGLLALCAAVFVALQASAGEFGGGMTNADVVGLVRSNVPEATIINQINGTRGNFDLSNTAVVVLQSNGVSDNIINAMTASSRSSSLTPLDDARFRMELANIASGDSGTRYAGLSWMQANRDQSLPALRQALADQRPEMRMAALSALGHLRDRASLPGMRNLITDSSPMVRKTTAQVLAEMEDSESIAAAETALSRPLNHLDGYARLLGYARLTRAAGVLGQVLSSNPEALTRAAAAWAIGEIGRPGIAGRPAVEKALESDSDPSVRREAAAALAKFHDERSARLLEQACRRDYEVRKVALAAMAGFPESVGFLIDVMNLAPDQISGDEIETARASLVRLTSQDFGPDGGRWSQWYSANRDRYPAQGGGLAAGASVPAFNANIGLPGAPATSPSQVDVEAWSIVADSSAIPMAPQVDGGRSPAGMGRGLMLPAGSGAGATPARSATASPLPVAPSPRDFEAATPDLTRMSLGGPAVPSRVPEMDLRSGTVADDDSASSSSLFQTWSSDPKRSSGGEASAAGPSRPSSEGFTGAFPDPYEDEDYSGESLVSAPNLPSSVVTPMASPPPTGSDATMRGVSLSLPGLPAAAAPAVQPNAGMESGTTTISASEFESPALDDDSAAELVPHSGGDPYAADSGIYGNEFEGMGLIDSASDSWQDSLFAAPDSETFEGVATDDPYAAGSPVLSDPAAGTVPDASFDALMYQPLDGTATVSEQPSSPAAPSTDGLDGLFAAPSGDVQPGVDAEAGSLFVTPEPGQEVVGEPLMSMPDASAGGQVYEAQPTDGFSDFTTPYEYETVSSDGDAISDAFASDPTIDPAASDAMAPEGTFIGEPYTDPEYTTDQTYVGSEPASVGDPAAIAEPTSAPQAAPPPDPFNFSSEMPPFRPEGTISAPPGKEVPMLGEGMFKK